MTTYVCYHHPCPDGAMAAVVARRHLRTEGIEPVMVPSKYGDEPPSVSRDDDVYLVDFSFKSDVVERLVRSCRGVTIYDHHQTAIEDLGPLMALSIIDGDLSTEDSGCILTHMNMAPRKAETPQVLLHVEDRDLWKFELPGTREICAAIMSYDLSDLDALEPLLDLTDLSMLLAEGTAIERYRQQMITDAVASATLGVIAGREVWIANCAATIGSDVAGALALRDPHRPFAAYWHAGDGKRKWGLRSRGEDGADVAAVAELFGGGGHRNAAGFVISVPSVPLLAWGESSPRVVYGESPPSIT